MKYLTCILILAAFLSAVPPTTRTRPEMVDPIISQFIADGLENDFDASYQISTHLSGIYFMPESEFKRYLPGVKDRKKACIGLYHNHLTNRFEVILLIDNKLPEEDVNTAIYHELGHFFGLDHDNSIVPDVMNEIRTYGDELTRAQISRLFRKIKEVPPNDYYKTINLPQ